MVPNGWREGRVRDLIKSLNAGVSVNSEDDGNLSSSYKILKTSCVSKGIFDPNKTKSVIEDVEISRLKEPVLCDSIIISRMNTPALVGANGYIENGIENTYLPDRLWQAKPKSNDVSMKWLGYWFASSHTRYTLSSTATGTSGSMKNITKSDVLNIKIDIPPLTEQRKIAKILSTWDKAISTTERLIDNSKQQKKALMQQLLTGAHTQRKRLLDDSGKPFEGEWEEVLVGNVAELTAGGTPSTKKSEYWGGDIPWMNSGEINLKQVFSVEGRITELGLQNSSTKPIPKNSVLIALAGQGKTRGTVAINRIELCTNQSIAAIMPNRTQLYPEFLYFNLDNRYQELRSMSTGDGGRGGLNLSILKAIRLQLPSISEQKKIASVLTNADKEIEVLQQQLSDLKQEKKALMQQLLTGKRRVTIN